MVGRFGVGDIVRYSQRELRWRKLYPTFGAVSVGPVLRWAAQPKQKQREEFADPFLVLRRCRRRFLTPRLEQFLLTKGSFLYIMRGTHDRTSPQPKVCRHATD